jgi:hypothetical protein
MVLPSVLNASFMNHERLIGQLPPPAHNIRTCSLIGWLMAGAGLFWEKSTAGLFGWTIQIKETTLEWNDLYTAPFTLLTNLTHQPTQFCPIPLGSYILVQNLNPHILGRRPNSASHCLLVLPWPGGLLSVQLVVQRQKLTLPEWCTAQGSSSKRPSRPDTAGATCQGDNACRCSWHAQHCRCRGDFFASDCAVTRPHHVHRNVSFCSW